MDLIFLKADWGMEHLGPMPRRLAAFRAAGFDGVECGSPAMPAADFEAALDGAGMRYAAMIAGDDEAELVAALRALEGPRPMFVNAQAGRDWYDPDRAVRMFETVGAAASDLGLTVLYETHRSRCLSSPWATEKVLEALPWLRLTADLSHFTNVCESLLTDPPYSGMIDMIVDRTDHIHARVGTTQAPQAADPRVGEGLELTAHFEAWWDRIVAARLAEGRPELTIDPEFGPPPYQPVDPATGRPHADIFDVAQWLMGRFRDRWKGPLSPDDLP